MKKKSPLESQIEKITSTPMDSGAVIEDGIEEFVPGLLKEIREGAALPKTDLKTKASAKKAVLELDEKLKELKAFQHRVRSLRELLLQKKHAMVSAQVDSQSEDIPEDLD